MSARTKTMPKLTGLLGVVVAACGSVALAVAFPVAAIALPVVLLLSVEAAADSWCFCFPLTCSFARVPDPDRRIPDPLCPGTTVTAESNHADCHNLHIGKGGTPGLQGRHHCGRRVIALDR